MSSPPDLASAFEALLARSGGDLLLLVDDRLQIVRAGGDAGTLAERAIEELTGMSLIAAFSSAALDSVAREALSSDGATGDTQLGRLGSRSFSVHAVPVNGGVVLLLHDVTTLRRVERVRRDFIANISHELRTPLASIKLLAETLSSGVVADLPTTTDFAQQIEREVDHLAQLVDELLDLSMIESGETQLRLEDLDVGALIEDIARRIAPVAERRGIGVRQIAASNAVQVAADRERIGQALLNLAHNAMKYSTVGGEIRLGFSAQANAVRFFVADDGIGVPEAHQARLFERFYKVDRSRVREDDEATGSAGLGLAIVRHIAEAHGGSVGLESREGIGSTFWIELPKR